MVINSVYTKHTKGVRFLEVLKKAFRSQPRETGQRQHEVRETAELHVIEERNESFDSNETIGFNMEVETPKFISKKNKGGDGGMASKSLRT